MDGLLQDRIEQLPYHLNTLLSEMCLLDSNGDIVADGTTRHVMNDSLVFAPQVNKALRDERFLTVADVLALEEAHQHAAQS